MTDVTPNPRNELLAALFWNVPVLTTSASGLAFYLAMGPPPWRPRAEDSRDALSVAAKAVVAIKENRLDESVALLRPLIDSKDRWTSLLGLCLLAWSPAPE